MIFQDNKTITGLTEQETVKRLLEEGYNEFTSTKNKGFLLLVWNTIKDPIFLLLFGGGLVYCILGDLQEALILLGFIFFIIGISLYQEGKTEHAIEALRDLSSPRALVIRDGKQKRIAGREVVRGDILILTEGDRVSADARLLSCSHLFTDESLLTGESLPVRKVAIKIDEFTTIPQPGGDDLPFVYSGTLVVQGQGISEVQAIGNHTEMGKIGKDLQEIKPETTALQKEMVQLVNRLFGIAVGFCVVIVLVYGITRGDWLKATLAGITLAMAILPNEFPVVVTIFLALGAWRISQKQVLARRTSAVESLGSATVLCTDKTGTLTLNQMNVQQLLAYGTQETSFFSYDVSSHPREPLPEPVHELVEFSILASQRNPCDPMEKAFKNLGERFLANTEHIHNDWQLLQEYPLSPELLATTHVWRSADGKHYDIAAKGAPEAIADLCHFTPKQKEMLASQIDDMANAGLRLLGVAKASFLGAPAVFLPPHPTIDPDHLPSQQHDFPFQFLGLVGLSDPVRPMVASAIAECYSAGIRVIMITGDYPGTAQTIARQIGLLQMGPVMTGVELTNISDAKLELKIDSTNIFARVVPKQKLRIVNALKARGEVVAMTGDGVNDAPALKSAQIGVAMGGRGTDVAREAADLVLLNDDFSSIVESVKLGRSIFDNLRKAMSYLLAIHIPIAGISLIPVFFKLPLVLLPVHVAFLHLIIDPACSIVLEAEPAEANVMKRPPRNPKELLLGRTTLRLALLQGTGILVLILCVFLFSLYRQQDELDARAITFTTLILANLGLIISGRSVSRINLKILQKPNPAFRWVILGRIYFLALVLYVPFLRKLFSFSFLHPIDLLVCCGGGIIAFLWFEKIKLT